MNARRPTLPAFAVLLVAAVAGGCTPAPPGAGAEVASSAYMARAAALAAATPWYFSSGNTHGEVVRIEKLWMIDIDAPDVEADAVPGQDWVIGIGRYQISVMLENGELRTVLRSHLGDLRVGDQVRLHGDTLLRT